MQIHKLASQALKYMVAFKTPGTVEIMAEQLRIDTSESGAVMKYILRRRKSWFSTVCDERGGPAYVISPKYIAEVVKFLDKGGFR